MMTASEKLYELLPAIHRLRDAEHNDALKSYLSVIAEQIEVIQENIEQLYDDQFIETCAEWAVPYLGDLIGYKTLYNPDTLNLSQRAEVANTIAYRRRKGTAVVLEQLARDVTGWPARVVEFFQILATTQYMNHVRANNHYAPDLRNWQALEYVESAFDSVARTADVRHIETDLGRYNIRNIGIYLWRLNNYFLTKSPLQPIEPGHYYFNALQHDAPLFNKPIAEERITQLAQPENVPAPINRRSMDAYKDSYYGEGKSVTLYDNFNAASNTFDTVPAADIRICCLADPDGNWINDPDGSVIAIDPEAGRISLGSDLVGPAPDLWADFQYGFSADMGGGEYERSARFNISAPAQTVTSPQTIQSGISAVGGEGIVEITNSGRYVETFSISVNASASIELRASNEHRPLVVLGDELIVTGDTDGVVILDGLVIAGAQIRVPEPGNNLKLLHLRHCTLVPGHNLDNAGKPVSPGAPSIVIESASVRLVIEDSIVGGIRAVEGSDVVIHNTIIDANSQSAVAYAALDNASPAGSLKIENSTVIGKLHTRLMTYASNCIFDARLGAGDAWSSPLQAERKQQGCVRFSYVPLDARLPRRYRCQPELKINQEIHKHQTQAGVNLTAAEKADLAQRIASRLRPSFETRLFDQPAYCQLALSIPTEISMGSDDESEMGAFHDLYQPQREANLKLRLKEYLRFGLEAGIFYET